MSERGRAGLARVLRSSSGRCDPVAARPGTSDSGQTRSRPRPPADRDTSGGRRHGMTVKPEELKTALVEKALGQVRERVDGSHAPILEAFVRAYYNDAAPEDLDGLDLYGAALA